MKVIDPLCKMTIDSQTAATTSRYAELAIYFCNPAGKTKFDREQEWHAGK